MQNEHGLIKIGRSDDPERRRRSLETEEMCRIAIVAVQENWGEFEEEIHIDMGECRVLGEWFEGDDFTREMSLIHFNLPPVTPWPFEYDIEAAGAWLDRVEEWRWFRTIRKFITAVILELKREPGSPYLDSRVWWAMSSARQISGGISVEENGQMVVVGADATREHLLPYSTDVEAALTLWPEGERPARWLRSAADCCSAALRSELEKLAAEYHRDRGSVGRNRGSR